MTSASPVQPVAPTDMTILFAYACPFCGQANHVPAPLAPGMLRCGNCMKPFPIIPVDERTIRYIHLMLDNGRAAADADFI